MTCPICSSSQLHDRVKGGSLLHECASCGVTFSDRTARRSDPDSYYANEYTLTETVRTSTERHRLFRLPEYLTLLKTISTLQPPPGTWLDVGCDHGFFLDEARRAGYRVQGVEPAAAARAYAVRIGLDVRSTIDDIDGSFDVISLWHVLEHIAEPRDFLATLASHLNSGGVIAIRVPNYASLWSRLLGKRWIWFHPHIHVFHYSASSLRELLERSGFTIEFVRCQRPNSLLTRRSYRFANTVFARTTGLSRPSLRDRLARLYQDITGAEIFAVARKQ